MEGLSLSVWHLALGRLGWGDVSGLVCENPIKEVVEVWALDEWVCI